MFKKRIALAVLFVSLTALAADLKFSSNIDVGLNWVKSARLVLKDSDGSNTVSIAAPNIVSGDRLYLLPDLASFGDFVGTTGPQIVTNKRLGGGTPGDYNAIILPGDTKSNLDLVDRNEASLLWASDEKKVYVDDGTTLSPVGSDAAGVPSGTVTMYAGNRAPEGYVMGYGQALSRATYAELLNALTVTLEGNTTNGSVNIDLNFGEVEDTSILQVGMKVEGTGIPAGATIASIVDTETITISAAATVSGTNNLRFFTYNNGDGSTTFNIPDCRGRTLAGRDNMGGTDAERLLSSAPFGMSTNRTKVGGAGGDAWHQLAESNIPQHGHSINHDHASQGTTSEGSHTHGMTHTHTYSGTSSGQSLNHSHNVTPGGGPFSVPSGSFYGVPAWNGGSTTGNAGSDHTHTYSGTTSGASSSNTGAGSSHSHSVDLPNYTGTSGNYGSAVPDTINNVQPTIVMNCLIKY